ncbi:hypothetical protein TTHERM_00069520 (macronuclear) [Tetrahymena thermophila SB210]|uniref:Uncharacterized protein n=1 Tax=Tetrahymena thermophila (strain SB210) TaxID=312017 RepID=I7M6Z6_TETTS|nr:hypothetical protein TTHERM_00069520 [Tetrahymena thermophila SB210]EAR87545.2 hypothetical protein TTHERM_00069520 [Tetrahymena thermophila SB210]|eukprot:XP_001007790.2 hypothetical protein TTHERM_00069520 [Tetrahymena thermophila SB210]
MRLKYQLACTDRKIKKKRLENINIKNKTEQGLRRLEQVHIVRISMLIPQQESCARFIDIVKEYEDEKTDLLNYLQIRKYSFQQYFFIKLIIPIEIYYYQTGGLLEQFYYLAQSVKKLCQLQESIWMLISRNGIKKTN